MNLYSLARFEETGFSILFRESGFAFFSTLSVHALAMALVVGTNVGICLMLILSKTLKNKAGFAKFYPLHWCAVVIIFISGLLLLVAYPAKALTNPVFYFKLATLTQGLMVARYIQLYLLDSEHNALVGRKLKTISFYALLLWIMTISAGRFLAYTHSILLASSFY